MIVVIDNYDSFTYNLVQYLSELGSEVGVFRNDMISVDDVRCMHPSHIVISPGPGTPTEAGISIEIILKLGPEIPTLGVCLGHQCIGHAFGGRVTNAPSLMHGKTSLIFHNSKALFEGISNPFEAMRYHSLTVLEPLPTNLELLAYTKESEVMSLRHRTLPIFGVQFHPESILTRDGKQILNNFLSVT